jgi:hypothetical protein
MQLLYYFFIYILILYTSFSITSAHITMYMLLVDLLKLSNQIECIVESKRTDLYYDTIASILNICKVNMNFYFNCMLSYASIYIV